MSLEGIPKDNYFRRLEESTDETEVFSWTFFRDFLRDLVADPINREMDVQQKFTDAKQGDRQSVREFDTYLAALESQMEPFTETQKRDNFLTRIRPEIKRTIKDNPSVPETRSDLVALAHRLEANRKKDIGGREDRDNRSSESHKRARRASPERTSERQRGDDYKKNITCHNCDKKGHYASECKFKRREISANKVPINNIQGKDWTAQETQARSPEQGQGERSSSPESPSRQSQSSRGSRE